MKKIKYCISALLIMIMSTGCEDFLDKNPPSSLSDASFWLRKSDFDVAIASCYAVMRESNGWMAVYAPFWDDLTDNGYGQHNEGGYGLTTAMVQGEITSNSGGFISDLYGGCYRAIARVNIFISKLEEYKNPDISPDDRNIYLGEASFLRAFFYSYLYRTYGDVPLVTVPLDKETQYQPKVEASKIAEQMFKDLDEAIRLLPDQTYSAAKGRLTKNAARVYKARMTLYDAYDASGNAVNSKMSEALALLNQVSGYSLSAEYGDIFQPETQENNPEIIFSVKYLAPNLYHVSDRYFGYWTCISPLTNLVNEYEFSDGSPFDASDPRYDAENPMANRDSRMAKTISFGTFKHNGYSIPQTNPLPTGYQVSKFIARGDGSQLPSGEYSLRNDNDWVHLRYAEVLLMKAEAENEASGPSAAVYEAVDAVRARSGLPALPAGLTKEQMREKIRHEYRVEFAFEGLRYFDLKRWKIISSVMNSLTEPKLPNFKPQFKNEHYKWPLPYSEIEKNAGILIQNPDYK